MTDIFIGESKIWGDLRHVGDIVSSLTGNSLHVYEFEADVLEAQLEVFKTGLRDGFRLENGLDVACVDRHASSSLSGGWHYSVKLTQAELIAPSTVTIDGLALQPLQYEEEVSDGERRITLVARATAEAVKFVGDAYWGNRVVSVTRSDINADEFAMRVGSFKHSDEATGVYVAVSLDTEDSQSDSVPWLSSFGAGSQMAALARAAEKVVVRKLVEKGVLTEEDMTSIDAAMQAEAKVQFLELDRIDSLSACRLKTTR